MALTRTPRHVWVEQGLRMLAGGGPGAVRVEALARELGVTKGGFYWHFEGRPALLREMLDTWERSVIDDVIDDVESHGGDARAKLHRLYALAANLHDELRRVELAVRDWARRDLEVSERLRRVDNRRMAYMRSLFAQISSDDDEVEARCLLVMTLFVGLPFVQLDHQGRRRSDVVERALSMLER